MDKINMVMFGIASWVALTPCQANAKTDVVIPSENKAGYDKLCRDDWTKRGILNNEMYDYCMNQQRDGYIEFREAVDKYKDAIWIQALVDYAVNEWTKRDVRNDQMVAYEVKRQEDGFEDLAYEVKQAAFNKQKFDTCLDTWAIQFHMVMSCYKDEGRQATTERNNDLIPLHHMFDDIRAGR